MKITGEMIAEAIENAGVDIEDFNMHSAWVIADELNIILSRMKGGH